MLTTVIILLALIISAALILAIVNDSTNNHTGLYVWSEVIVLFAAILSIVYVNQEYSTINSKTIINPTIKIEITKTDSIVNSDTTYIYKFKNIE